MKRALAYVLALICIGLVIRLGGSWWASRNLLPESSEPSQSEPVLKPARAGAGRSATGADPVPSGTAPAAIGIRKSAADPANAQAPDYLARLRASGDFREFAESIVDTARQGDGAAQYYLSQALFHCESLYDWYFIEHLPGGATRTRTLDEAQQISVTRRVLTADDVRDLQKKCQRLRDTPDPKNPPFGTSRQWLDLAIANRYPLAQVQASLDKAMQLRAQPTEAATSDMRDEARRMALEALRTGDPHVMARMGDVAGLLASGDESAARKAGLAWPLAACLRAPGCDALRDWMHLYCNIDGQCQPFETPADVIRRMAGNDYDEIERRAREFNEKIDAGTLGESDL